MGRTPTADHVGIHPNTKVQLKMTAYVPITAATLRRP
jgi:hypothetical protein